MDLLPALFGDEPARPLDRSAAFTPAMAARSGLGRTALDRLVRADEVVRLVRGVYVDRSVDLTPASRARALSLVVSRRHLVVDRTAAWVHGAPALRPRPDAAIPLDLYARRRYPGGRVPVGPEEIDVLSDLRCTSPLRTALDVARHLAPERALALLDGLLRARAVTHGALMAGAAASAGLAGATQARELAAIADGRARNIAESALRLHWLNASLPTPTPGFTVVGVRLALALPVHRFGVVLLSETSSHERLRASARGWRVVALDGAQVTSSDSAAAGGHLVREFHRHLLNQMA